MKKVVIISTGNELVYGSVHEANCFFISGRLFPTDFRVIMHITVGDRIEDLEYAIKEGEKRADVVIITGGLGPTDDDHTLAMFQGIYGFKTCIYSPGRERMELFFRSIDREVMEGDLKQVTVPEGAYVFENEVGLAAGFAFRTDRAIIAAMPGVPSEMETMFDKRVLPYLSDQFNLPEKSHVTVRTILMREAQVNDLIKGMDIPLDEIEWGITTVWGMNTLTFVQRAGFPFPAREIIEESKRVFGDKMLSPDSESLEGEVVNLLRKKGLTISVAESCTGGLVQKRITDIPGASAVFTGGVVTYSNESKIKLTGVREDSLARFGAVSEEVAAEMAEGARKKFNSDIAVSVTGIAGPDGGTDENPVGTVCFGFAAPGGGKSFETRIVSHDRERIRYFSSQYALDNLRIYLNKK